MIRLIIQLLHQLLQKVDSRSLEYISREENIEIDRIVKKAFGREEDLQLFEISSF